MSLEARFSRKNQGSLEANSSLLLLHIFGSKIKGKAKFDVRGENTKTFEDLYKTLRNSCGTFHDVPTY